MNELIKRATKLKEQSINNSNQDEIEKYESILETLNKPNWFYEVQTEAVIKMLEDLKIESPNEVYANLIVSTLNF